MTERKHLNTALQAFANELNRVSLDISHPAYSIPLKDRRKLADAFASISSPTSLGLSKRLAELIDESEVVATATRSFKFYAG